MEITGFGKPKRTGLFYSKKHKRLALPSWHDKISNPAQLGGIETSVLDNGLGRGTRIAWINTGSGLRFKVAIDRGMDIADCFYNQYSLAWLSHSGLTAHERSSNQGLEWLKTFGGGLLTTCGLTHVGGPEKDEWGERGLHDEASNLPAELEAVIQPDPLNGRMEMSMTGTIRQTRVFGPSLELKRTISATLGKADIRIHDEVLNRGNVPAAHMLLYHCNCGWPLVDEGSALCWNGGFEPRHNYGNAASGRNGNDFRICPPVMEDHRAAGESVAFIQPVPADTGQVTCGIHNPKIGLAFAIKFHKRQLPWLINWQHFGRGEYVTALEPATNPPIGQAKAREQQELIFIQPGETRQYDLEIEVYEEKEKIDQFLKDTMQHT